MAENTEMVYILTMRRLYGDYSSEVVLLSVSDSSVTLSEGVFSTINSIFVCRLLKGVKDNLALCF